MENCTIFVLATLTAIVATSGSFAVSGNASSTEPTSTSVKAEVNEHTNSSADAKRHYQTTTQLISVNGSSESPLNAATFFNSSDLVNGSSNVPPATVATNGPAAVSGPISSTKPTTASVKTSAASTPHYPTTTELISVNGSSESPFDAETFFNSSHLVDGHSNTTTEDAKLANSSSSDVPPVNASSEQVPTQTSPSLAETQTPEYDRPSVVSHNSTNKTEAARPMNTAGAENSTVTPGKSGTHSSQTGENALNTPMIVKPSVTLTSTTDPTNSSTTDETTMTMKPSVTNSTTDLTNSSTTEEPLPQNPNDPWQNEYGAIIHASVFFINGVTTPPEPYEKDRYNASVCKNELNRLTNLGKLQSYQLGEWFAKRYSNLLHSGQFSSRTVRIDSGQSENVFMSAESLLAGLFPPRGAEIWNAALLWQPIPIYSEPPNQDSTVSMSKVCRRYDLDVESTNKMSEWTREFKMYEDSFNFIANNTGFSFSQHNMFNNLLQAYDCYEKLTAERQLNLSLPEWTKKEYPQPLETLAVKYLQFTTHTDEMKKFKAGPFLKSLVDDLQKIADIIITDNSNQKLHLYSGNAYGLAAIMNTLGIFNSIVPPPASALLFEFREKNAITVSLKNTTAGPPYLLQIKHCETVCDYTKFISIASQYIPSNWEDECRPNIFSFDDLTFSTPLVVTGLVVVIVLIFLCVLLSIKIYKCLSQKKRNNF